MPVIINDLEVILESAETAPAGTPETPAAPQAETTGTALAPKTLERIELHRRARAARIRSH